MRLRGLRRRLAWVPRPKSWWRWRVASSSATPSRRATSPRQSQWSTICIRSCWTTSQRSSSSWRYCTAQKYKFPRTYTYEFVAATAVDWADPRAARKWRYRICEHASVGDGRGGPVGAQRAGEDHVPAGIRGPRMRGGGTLRKPPITFTKAKGMKLTTMNRTHKHLSVMV